MAVIMALILDKVRTGVHFQEPLQHGCPPFLLIYGAQLVELRFPFRQILIPMQPACPLRRLIVRGRWNHRPGKHTLNHCRGEPQSLPPAHR